MGDITAVHVAYVIGLLTSSRAGREWAPVYNQYDSRGWITRHLSLR